MPAAAAAGSSAAATAAIATAAADGYAEQNVSSSGVSQFLPTTWRLRAFSNGRVARPDERIVYVHGAFDLLHSGHVGALYAARQQGDFLLVGLHDDATVNKARGHNHPIATLHERALCVLALGCVDEVILGAPPVVSADLLNSMNIQLVVGETDEPSDEPLADPTTVVSAVDVYAVPKARGIYRTCARRPSLRLEDIVARIIANRQRFEARNAKRERKELDYVLNQKAYVEEL